VLLRHIGFDLHNVLDIEFDPLTEAIARLREFHRLGANSIMSIERDGTASAYTWVEVATLNRRDEPRREDAL
jgi:hypothetical protein